MRQAEQSLQGLKLLLQLAELLLLNLILLVLGLNLSLLFVDRIDQHGGQSPVQATPSRFPSRTLHTKRGKVFGARESRFAGVFQWL